MKDTQHLRKLSAQFPSSVTQCKELYRRGSKIQRAMLRAWFARVLNGEDGKP